MKQHMFHIGNIVYPVEIDGSQCNATKEEMSRLYGVVVGLSNDDGAYRDYSVEWLDKETDEPAEFDHGLKNSWFNLGTLTSSRAEYIVTLDNLSFEEEDGEVDTDEVAERLYESVFDQLEYFLYEEYEVDDPVKYYDGIIKKLAEKLK